MSDSGGVRYVNKVARRGGECVITHCVMHTDWRSYNRL